MLNYVKFKLPLRLITLTYTYIRVVFNGGSNGAIFRYPLLIDFSSFGSKRDSGPHRRVVEKRFITDVTTKIESHRLMVNQNDS